MAEMTNAQVALITAQKLNAAAPRDRIASEVLANAQIFYAWLQSKG